MSLPPSFDSYRGEFIHMHPAPSKEQRILMETAPKADSSMSILLRRLRALRAFNATGAYGIEEWAAGQE